MPIVEQQRVFLAYRALFRGQNAQLRKGKAIRAVLKANNQTNSGLAVTLGYEKLVGIIKSLLERGIFESDLKAKLAFPALYQTSAAQDAAHEASEVGAARDEAEALQEVALEDLVDGGDESGEEAASEDAISESGVVEEGLGKTKHRAAEQASRNPAGAQAPSLYPTQFPFHLQHDILGRVQRLLEECCYDFTQRNTPAMLLERHWDCAETIELNKWTHIFVKRHGKLPSHVFKKTAKSLPEVLLSVNPLRHAAVHRLRISAKGISQMISHAVKFAEALSDPVRASLLQEILNEINENIDSQELHKNYLESRLKDELDEIDAQRKELDRRERAAIDAMVKENDENTTFVSSVLKTSLRQLFATEAINEDETVANGDIHSPAEDDDDDEEDEAQDEAQQEQVS